MKGLPKNIVYLDLFSGTGGFAEGLRQAGFIFSEHYFSEIDKYAAANYQYHFKNAQGLGDIKRIGAGKIKRPDLITFGSPCQDVSNAGKRAGIKGKRSGLFFEALRLIRLYRPRVFVFENVKGLFSSNGGKDFEAVLRAFADIGLYDLQWQLVNTAWFLPQNRERIYIVGHLRGTAKPKIFPIRESTKISQTLRAEGEDNENIASAITSNYSKGVHGRGETYVSVLHWKNSKEKWVNEQKDKIPTLKTQSELTRQPLIVNGTTYRIPEGTKKGYATATEGDSINLTFLSSKHRRGRVGKGKAHTLDTGANQYTIHKGSIRRLTPVECERLQGFKDDWTKYGLIGDEAEEISDTQRYKMLGNAVSVPAVKAIAKKLINGKNELGATDMKDIIALPDNRATYVATVKHDLADGKPHTKITLEKIAAELGISERNEVKELTELAIVETARSIAQEARLTIDEKYNRIVALYNKQANLSHRTSQSILLQQYSTPAPIGYLMGIFCRIDQLHKNGGYAFEPSAGNGLLTIAAKPERVYVNEIDDIRYRNLNAQAYANVWKRDATQPFFDVRRNFNAVLTNPPFGMMDVKMAFDGYPIQPLEHVMAIQALDCMADDGKAAIIIGGHTGYDKKGRMQAGKNRLFFNYLYSHYNVADVIPINGKKLYTRQGTGFNTRLILIESRKTVPEGNAPVYDKDREKVVNTFDELFMRVMAASKHISSTVIDQFSLKEPTALDNMEKEAKRLLDALRAEPLGATRSLENDYENRYLNQYLPLQSENNGALIFLQHGTYYEVFGRDVVLLNNLLMIQPTATFISGDETVQVISIKQNNIGNITSYLKKMGFRFILSDNEPLSFPVHRFRRPSNSDRPIWQIPLHEFLKTEEQEFKKQTRFTTSEIDYDLPYKPEYVALFNSVFTGDPFEHSPLNPYCPAGVKQLHDNNFRTECLNGIHLYNVRLAMKLDIVLSDAVLADYPKLKLKQDARIMYNKTLVTAGNQLNGQQAGRLTKDVFLMDLLKELGAELRPKIMSVHSETIKSKGLAAGQWDDDEIIDHDALFEQFRQKKENDATYLYLFETPETFCAFNEDAEALSRTCNIGLIKSSKNGQFQYFITGSSKSLMFLRFEMLKEAGHKPLLVENARYHTKKMQDRQDAELLKILKHIDRPDELGAAYQPASNACIVLDTQVPDSMAYETQEALTLIKEAVGGDVDNFVRDRLGYPTKTALCKSLSAEQTDAVMMAIYNIEARNQGMIIGDQTGIGKGRVAAAMIRYACHQGMKPVFLTEKANLFSDIYRDLYAIGSGRLKPFIVNGRESKTDIKDEDGNIIFQALPANEQQEIFSSRAVPVSYDFVVATYTQFNSPERKPEKPAFLTAIAEGNIFILDEAHNSSGSSNTGNFLQNVIAATKGVVFLSATFAKRPDNMPIYAMKTAISDCNMSRDQLVEAIQRGGVALQEVLSSQLVAEGQMLRRERSFEGVEVNYITLNDKAQEHRAIADNITGIVRDIIAFQKDFIDVIVEELDNIAVGEGKQVDVREGTSQAGVDNTPYFSKVFNIINQMLFSIKATSVAERAIERLKEGKKPIIAFASTMGSFLEDMEDENGLPVSDGSTINPDFSEVLRRGLEGVMRYTEKNLYGEPEYKKFELSELSPQGQAEYHKITKKIEEIATGITLSPIDVVVRKLRDAGYSVAEVTGRKFELQMNWNGSKAIVMARKRINTNDAFRQFNNNEVDVLMINQSGSTGASAHAITTAKVSKEEVKQRVMIVLQAELDINTEVQKRGRINRTGQIIKPIYDYVSSAIPAENRLMMMLQKKLKSLDANTASNQKQSSKILDVPDFLNKYGDKVVKEYLLENQNVNRLLDDPLRLKDTTDSNQGDADAMENAAHKVSGRVAVLSVKMQEDFYSEITERYSDYVAYLQQVGDYDLELEAMNLEAETMNSKVVKMGKGSGSLFSEDSMLETVKANVLKKPFTAVELENLLIESLQGEDPMKMQQELINDYNEETGMALEIEEKELKERFDEMDRRIYTEKKFQRLKTDQEREDYIRGREMQIEEARKKALEALRSKAANRKYYLEKIFRFFYVGRSLNFPVDNFDGYKEYVPTVFLGFVVDWKRKNPFLPSKIKLRFALANSSKYFAIPASYDDIDLIIGASNDLPQTSKEQMLLNWSNYIQENNSDRKTRHIITGNLLQAFSDFKGKLVNYTTNDGKINKGILMPEHWIVDEQVQDKVSIPVYKALPLIKSLVPGNSITTTTGIGFLKQNDKYKIIVPMSRKVGGDIYLDKQLLALVEGNNFQRTSDKMTAMLPFSNIDAFVEVVQTNHNCAVTITRHQFNSMEKQEGTLRNRKPIRPPEPEKEYHAEDHLIELLELEAEALALQLRLMAI